MPYRAFLVTLALSSAAPAGGEEAQKPAPVEEQWRAPLTNRNQFPLAVLFLSLEPSGTRLLPRGASSFALDFSYSNIITLRESAEETLVLDLEMLRTLVRWELGLGRGFQVGAALPLYALHGGFLDGVISGFHEAFDLPNSVRRREPDGLFRYQYRRKGVLLFERDEGGVAVGDLTLSLRRSVLASPRGELVARVALKLPSGSPEGASGSGAADWGFGLVASRRAKRIGGYLNASYHLLGNPSQLPSLMPKNYLALSGAADFPFRRNLSFVAQVDYLSPFLESQISTLDEGALQLALGLRYHRSQRFTFEWRFTEDLSKASPDITFGFRVEMYPGWGEPKP
jgi:hypothetical protein